MVFFYIDIIIEKVTNEFNIKMLGLTVYDINLMGLFVKSAGSIFKV